MDPWGTGESLVNYALRVSSVRLGIRYLVPTRTRVRNSGRLLLRACLKSKVIVYPWTPPPKKGLKLRRYGKPSPTTSRRPRRPKTGGGVGRLILCWAVGLSFYPDSTVGKVFTHGVDGTPLHTLVSQEQR